MEQFEVYRGSPTLFCATARDGGVNFPIFSANAVYATLCLISLSDLHDNKVAEQISLDPLNNKTGDVWHVFLKGDFKDMLYGYKFDGQFPPDEGLYYFFFSDSIGSFCKAVISRGEFGALGADGNCWPQMACMVPSFYDEQSSRNFSTIGIKYYYYSPKPKEKRSSSIEDRECEERKWWWWS